MDTYNNHTTLGICWQFLELFVVDVQLRRSLGEVFLQVGVSQRGDNAYLYFWVRSTCGFVLHFEGKGRESGTVASECNHVSI